jgi:hypothetical protein
MFVVLYSSCSIRKKHTKALSLKKIDGYVITHNVRYLSQSTPDLVFSNQFRENYSFFCSDFQDVEKYFSDLSKIHSLSKDELSTQIADLDYQIYSIIEMKEFDYNFDTIVSKSNRIYQNDGNSFLTHYVDTSIEELYSVKKVRFKGIRGDRIIEKGIFFNSRSHDLKKILIYDENTLIVFFELLYVAE